MGRGVTYHETECKSALNRVEGMSFRWSLNPYQGCAHGCHYCYARRYHAYRQLDPSSQFASELYVKTNVAAVLRQELRRPSWVGDQVAIGTATDPYQPIEGRYRLTRACLLALANHDNPASLVTKGTLIVRDTDILSTMAAGNGISVVFSLTTLDTDLWQRLEPGTPPPLQRLRAMQRLVAAGVRAGVLLAPILPGITDGPASLEQLVATAADHGAQFLGAQTLYLKEGTRQHFLGYLRQQHPQLLSTYARLFPGAYAPKRFQLELKEHVSRLKESYQLVDAPAPPKRAIQQLTFLRSDI